MILVIVLFIIWLYIINVLSRAKLYSAKFLVGCFGLFFYAMYFISPYLVKPTGNAVAMIAGIFGKLTGFYESFPEHSLIFISRKESFISFYIDYECSGIIEIFAFVALLWFYPLYNSAEKFIITLIGTAVIFFANVIRILIISTVIYYGGNDIFYFAHTVLGRIVFYAFSVTLYFYIFTKPHIIRQKVGLFTYGNNTDKDS